MVTKTSDPEIARLIRHSALHHSAMLFDGRTVKLVYVKAVARKVKVLDEAGHHHIVPISDIAHIYRKGGS